MRQNKEASKWVECGLCEKHCPQNIEIRKMLKAVIHTFAELVKRLCYNKEKSKESTRT
ncbi:MAG: hypothetical protein AB2421_05895 [Thermotaleaceae bacterium]